MIANAFLRNTAENKSNVLSIYCPVGYSKKELLQFLTNQFHLYNEQNDTERLRIVSHFMSELCRTFDNIGKWPYIFFIHLDSDSVHIDSDSIIYDLPRFCNLPNFRYVWQSSPMYDIIDPDNKLWKE